jgi:hypothetical protein
VSDEKQVVLIEADYAWRDSGLTAYDEHSEGAVRELLTGHSVAKVADDHLQLDDGTVLRIIPNQGGCACSAGDYELTELNGTENIITAVEFEEATGSYESERSYRIFVVADNKRVNLLTVDGDDGNGYYGTGYSILVRKDLAAPQPRANL